MDVLYTKNASRSSIPTKVTEVFFLCPINFMLKRKESGFLESPFNICPLQNQPFFSGR